MHPARESLASAAAPETERSAPGSSGEVSTRHAQAAEPVALEVVAGRAPASDAGHVAVVPDSDPLTQRWLDAQCAMVAGVSSALVVRAESASAEPSPVARWPAAHDGIPPVLLDAARQALRERTVAVRSLGEAPRVTSVLASPLLLPEGAREAGDHVAVALAVPGSSRRQHLAVVQLLQWGGTWYQLLREGRQPDRAEPRLATVVELLATSLEHERFEAAVTTTATEIAARLGCSRVSVGLLRGKHVEVRAMSHSARIDARSNLVREIGGAMDEAVDQDATITHPPVPGAPPHVAFAQEMLSRRAAGAAVCSTPLYSGDRAIGALTLERDGDTDFDAGTVELCESLAALLGPVVELKHEKDRLVALKVCDAIRALAGKLLGRGHLLLKLNALVALCLVTLLCVATGEYRITANARLEGSVMRVVTAPRDGFVASAAARAGDTVEAGQVLATLDDRELRLERLKLASESEQIEQELRAAVTGYDRSRSAILRARLKQNRAQLALADEQLARARLTAPFGGVVVSGDLSQELGSPVEHGQVLFEIAPLDGYRVILEIDERDIGDLTLAQRGELTLTGLPEARLPFTVRRIVPVSSSRDGANFFDVEAELDGAAPAVRPGMEGVGKVHVDRRRLVWIWTHTLLDWLRLALWTWVS